MIDDALIIGGGLAGAALAAEIAASGQAVRLIERQARPVDKVCGEFLSYEALAALDRLGVDPGSLGAVPIEAVRLIGRGQCLSAKLPFRAASLSRLVLDDAVLARAAEFGALVQRGQRVTALQGQAGDWHVTTDDGGTPTARTVFLATGKHDLRGWGRSRGWQNDLIAFKWQFRLSAPEQAALDRHVELILFRDGYAGLQPIEAGRANLCLVVRQRRLAALGRRPEAVLADILDQSPHLAGRLAGASPCWLKPLALSGIPYGFVAGPDRDGLWRVGDQAAVIPSFSGDGMAIALHSAGLAARYFLAGQAAIAYQRQLAQDVRMQTRLASLVSHGIVRGPIQFLLTLAPSLWPGLIQSLAGWTRIPRQAIRRADSPLRRGLG